MGAISHQEIAAWAQLMHIELYPHEVRALRIIDNEFVNYHYEKTSHDRRVSKPLDAIEQNKAQEAKNKDAAEYMKKYRAAQKIRNAKKKAHGR